MGESLTQRRRVRGEGLRVVNLCHPGRTLTLPGEEAPANSVPAAAVIRRVQALFGFTGRKGSVGGRVTPSWNPRFDGGNGVGKRPARGSEGWVELPVER